MGLTRTQKVMVVVFLAGTVFAVLNQTLLSPALPAIMADTGVDATTVQWLTSGYSLTEAVVIPFAAYFIGRFSTRQLFLGGMTLFTLGSLCAALAPSFPVLLLGRVLQAVGTGAVMPMVFTVILLIFPREKRGSAMGIISLVIGFAPAIGPSLSGLLVDSVGWRALFIIVTVLSALIVVVGFAVLKNYGDFKRVTFDPPSVALTTIGLVCLLYGLSTFSSKSNLPLTIGLIVVGAALMAVYVRRQLKLETPMLQVGILRTRRYATAVIVIVIVQAALMGTGVIIPLFIQGTLGNSATVSGVAMLPGAVLGALMSFIAGRLFDRYGVRKLAIPGGVLTLAGAFGMAALGIDASILSVAAVYTVMVVGLQTMMTPLNTWGVNSLDNSVIQHAQGVSNTLNQIAGAFGTALLVSISALSPMLAPQAGALEQQYLGQHLAFCVMTALLVVAFVVVCALVSDKPDRKASKDRAGAARTASGVAADPLTVGYAMDRSPVSVPSDAPMREVVRVMAESDTSGVPVVDSSGILVGFVSDGDVASYLGKNELSFFDPSLTLVRFSDEGDFVDRLDDLLDLGVMNVATRRVVTVEAGDSIDDACHVLAEKRIKKVPVVQDGKLVGTLSRRNIIHAIADARGLGAAERA
ncbi:MAG TPA: DHA2 family efflux MFS transporter permease subunit [Candidatus Aphodovivens excrementavium]|nr:DHA2 family efflux MFS transporter permease subunit [Candidatus Aphodovivens excrementavium]